MPVSCSIRPPGPSRPWSGIRPSIRHAGGTERVGRAVGPFQLCHQGPRGLLSLAPNGHRGALVRPGSTFKVVTGAAVYNLMPSLATSIVRGPVPDLLGLQRPLCDQGGPCGGTMQSHHPARVVRPRLRRAGCPVGHLVLAEAAELFGYNSVQPLDLPDVVVGWLPTWPLNHRPSWPRVPLGNPASPPRSKTPWWPPALRTGAC